MRTELPKQHEQNIKQAKSESKGLGLFAMLNSSLNNFSDVELKARQLVNKLANKLPKKSTQQAMQIELKDNEYLDDFAEPSNRDESASVDKRGSLAKAAKGESLSAKGSQFTEFKQLKDTSSTRVSDLPNFLKRDKPSFSDLENFQSVKAEQILLEDLVQSAPSSQMPQVLAELRKKLNFDFLNNKEQKQDSTKNFKKPQVQLEALDDAELAELLKNITVIAFVGPSGTGKSTRANQVAFLSKCNYIIDDALLIKDNHIVAGSSAKRAKTKIESVRQAIFLDPIRAQTMKRALASHLPKRLLILGTSQSMINKICQALSLQEPKEWINIKDVATESEIKQARYNRIHTGQHAIPVPSMELKHEFSGSIFEPLQLLKQRFSAKDIANGVKEIRHSLPSLTSYAMTASTNRTLAVEQSIVRPSFSVLGHYSITDQALKNIVLYSLQKVEAVQKMRECKVRQETSGLVFNINLALYYGYNAQTALKEAEFVIVDAVSRMTAMNILQVTLVADKLVQIKKIRRNN